MHSVQASLTKALGCSWTATPPNLIWGQHLPFFEGKFRTSTIRNAGQVPYRGFVKAYMHNGYLLSLKEVVHFYNTRDVYPQPVLSGHQRERSKK
jgi:cytochrome c peroxidase